MRQRHHIVFRLAILLSLVLTTVFTTAGDWPTFLHDAQRTSNSSDETTLSTANAPQLQKLWSFQTTNSIAASPTIVNGVVYVGSWDGYEYALDAATGALKWKTYLGQTTTTKPSCIGGNGYQGVTSAAAVQNGAVYVGGGDSYWYALDAGSGSVLWRVFTGDNTNDHGWYNWASPLLYNGFAYIGIASLCDNPLVQGQLLKVDLSTHQVVATFNAVPNGQVGGGIWTSPSIDTATNTIYLTTGTNGTTPTANQPQSLAMVALDATTLALKGSWQVPPSQQTTDSDWSTTPTVFDDPQGHHLVAGFNKGGYLYAFDRTNVSAGPLWQRQVANGGPNPTQGDGSISSSAFGGGMLYFAGGNTTVNGVSVSGSVRALDPATGNIIWEQGTGSLVGSALVYANGLLVDTPGSKLEVRNAATGARLYTYATGGPIYSAPSISNGRIYVGSNDGNLYAFGFPNSGAYAGSIGSVGGANNYAFTPDANGTVTVGSCSSSTSNVVSLALTDSTGSVLGSGTNNSYCNWVSASVSAGQTYTATTTAVAGTGSIRVAWSVNGTPVVWSYTGGGYYIGTRGGSQYMSFPTLTNSPMTLATCGPTGVNFDLYLLDAFNHTLASSTSPSNCETLTYTATVPGLFRLKEVAVGGAGGWTGTVTTDGASGAATATPTASASPSATASATPSATASATATPTNTPAPSNTPIGTPGASATATNTATPTNTAAPSATATATPAGPVAGTYSGTITTSGGTATYTFAPGAGGAATVGSCATTSGVNFDLAVYDSGGNALGSSTTPSNCDWVNATVSAGQTYTVVITATAGSGGVRSAWNVNGAPVTWTLSGSSYTIGTVGSSQYLSFPTLSAGPITLSTCGPSGSNFDLYLLDANNTTLAGSATPSTCESLTYTPSAPGLFRLKERATSGTGAWSGTITTQ